MFNRKLICITGVDGSGKSTIVKALSQKFPKAVVSEVWDALNQDESKVFSSKKEIDKYLCSLTPNSRLLFLAHALKYSIDKCLQSNAELIILNGYYYKYFATELALGADLELVKQLQTHFPEPDLVVRLNLDTEVIASRKQFFSAYECGAQFENTSSQFIHFQKLALEKWNHFDQENWTQINTSQSIEIVLQDVLKNIETI